MTAKKEVKKEEKKTVDHLELWNKVQTTDPKYTKKAKLGGGFEITAINAQYQIKRATEMWGGYGVSWGLKNIQTEYIDNLTNQQILCVAIAKFYMPNGEFEIGSSIFLQKYSPKYKSLQVDDEFRKKLETDILTKALSKCGFNSDVFLGLYDDNRYINKVREEFKDVPKETPKAPEQPKQEQPKQEQPKPKTKEKKEFDNKTAKIANDIGGTKRDPEVKDHATAKQLVTVKKILMSSNLHELQKKEYRDKITEGTLTKSDATHIIGELGKRAKHVRKVVEESVKLKVLNDEQGEKLRAKLTQMNARDLFQIDDFAHAKLDELAKSLKVK